MIKITNVDKQLKFVKINSFVKVREFYPKGGIQRSGLAAVLIFLFCQPGNRSRLINQSTKQIQMFNSVKSSWILDDSDIKQMIYSSASIAANPCNVQAECRVGFNCVSGLRSQASRKVLQVLAPVLSLVSHL